MLVCPRCAEDLADDVMACSSCGSALPTWLTRPPISTPPARSSFVGWAIVVLGSVLLFVEVSSALGWLAFLDTLHRR
jgi:hypothetical protein